jgi:TetR/AcrR family transcriptional regulator
MTTTALAVDSRDAILDAATELFARQGLEATSIKSIGAAAGVNPALLYYYFADKTALYRAVIDRIMERFPAQLVVTATMADSPASGLAAIVRQQAEVFLAQPLLPRLIARELADHDATHATPIIRDTVRRLIAAITGLIRAGQAAGEFRPDLRPELAAISVLSQVNWFCIAGPVVEIVLDQPGITRDPLALRGFADHVVRFSMAGLQAMPEERL